jgi:Rrf2 family protein
LLALVYLARAEADGYVTVKTVAKAQGIPPKFLEQLLLTLKRAKYVRSLKGQGGGYRLAKPADSISLAEIIRLFDGALAPTESVSEYFYAPTPVEKEKSLVRVFRHLRDYVSAVLEQTTIADSR